MENQKTQITESQRKTLEKQQYRIIGNHSAVKVCNWTKNMIVGKGSCYKGVFYGIKSHQCLQMTCSMFCANRCKFCWRSLKAPVAKKWHGEIDEPEFIFDEAIKQHIKLLQGFKGFKKSNKIYLNEMKNVRHVALSLTGEPIIYPRINELLDEFHKRNISTFLVTNAQYPEQIKRINNVTQLYISLDAPNKELLKKIDNPVFSDYWERLIKSIKVLSTRKYRTCIRLTLIKGENMDNSLAEDYAKLINLGNPCFIEIKAYMHVGDSLKFYMHENMPSSNDIKKFTAEILKFLPNYEFAAEHYASRVVLLARRDMASKRFIDFDRLFCKIV